MSTQGVGDRSPVPVSPDHDLRGVLRIPAFRKLWTALSLSSFGDWLGLLALTALAPRLANDSYAAANLAIAGVFILRLAPAIVIGPLGGRGRRPARPPLDDGGLRPGALRAVPVDPARRHPVVAVRRDLPHRGREPDLDPGQGSDAAQPRAARAARDGQPAQPVHDLRFRAGRRRGVRRPRAAVGHARQRGARRSTGRARAVLQRRDVPGVRADHPAAHRDPRAGEGRAGRRDAGCVAHAGRGLALRRPHPAGAGAWSSACSARSLPAARWSAWPARSSPTSAAATPATACCSARSSSGWPPACSSARGWCPTSAGAGCSA